MARQQDRQKARAMKKKMLDEARAATPIPTMKVPLLGQKPELKDFAQSVDELELLGDLVLIREISQEKTAGGIVLPDGAKQEGPRKGEVMVVGKGAMREDGTYMPMQVKVGDLIYLTLGARSAQMQIGGEAYHMVPDSAIMVKVRKQPSQEVTAGTRDGSIVVTE